MNIGRGEAGMGKSLTFLDETEPTPADVEALFSAEPDADGSDLSKQLTEARRAMRAKLLAINDVELKDLYYRALMLSEHEAARLAVERVLARSHLSNKAEALAETSAKERIKDVGSFNGQKHNAHIAGRYAHVNKFDVVFTPDWLAALMCSMFPIAGAVLEPCKGEGVFLKYLPAGAEWCEIADGRNFYDYAAPVDWIVTNPPYSDFNRFLTHSFSLAENVVLLVPLAKLFKSMETLKLILDYGGFVSVDCLGARQAGFPFGFPCAVYHMQRGYRGTTRFGLLKKPREQELFDAVR